MHDKRSGAQSMISRPQRARLVRSGLWSVVTQVASKLALLAYTVGAARALEIEDLGELFALYGAALVLAVALDAGGSTLVLRQLSVEAVTVGRQTISDLNAVRLVLGLLLAAVGLVAVLASWADTATVLFVICIAAANAWWLAFNARLEAAGDYGRAAFAVASGRMVLVAGTLVAFVVGGSTVWYVVIAVSEGATAVLAFRLAPRVARATVSIASAVRSVRESVPHAGNSLINVVYNRGDVTLVALFGGAAVAGLYTPASQVQNAAGGLLAAFYAGVLSSAGALGQEAARAERTEAVRMASIASLRLGLPIFTGVALAAGVAAVFVLPLVLGESFDGSVVPTIILLVSLPAGAIITPLLQGVIAAGRAWYLTCSMAVALAVSLLAHSILVPAFGATGGAIAALSREPVLIVGMVLAWRIAFRSTRTSNEGTAL